MPHGFQERDKSQLDLPTVAKESFKLLIALATNKDFELATLDIRATIEFCEGNKIRYSRSVDCFQGLPEGR